MKRGKAVKSFPGSKRMGTGSGHKIAEQGSAWRLKQVAYAGSLPKLCAPGGKWHAVHQQQGWHEPGRSQVFELSQNRGAAWI